MSRIHRHLFSALVLASACLITALAIAVHLPGQLSFDSIMQLQEAATGTSLSWNPPFMSALIRWFGGGELGATAIVVICCVFTYFGFWLFIDAMLKAKAKEGVEHSHAIKLIACLAFIVNPIIFVNIGIVWKDIIFSSFLSLAIALSFQAAVAEFKRAVFFSIAAAVLLSAALLIRQQGIFMAPILLCLPIIALLYARGFSLSRKLFTSIGLCLCLVFSSFFLNMQAKQSIVNAGDKSTSVGLRMVMMFDIAGIIVESKLPGDALPATLTPVQREAIEASYSSKRIDFMAANRDAMQWFDAIAIDQTWQHLVRQQPEAYLKHRLAVFSEILNLKGVEGCLPIHVGVTGRKDFLAALGINSGTDRHDQLVYDTAAVFFEWPIYRHWFYLILLLIASIALCFTKMPTRIKPMCMVMASATWLYYFSYLLTGVACDFRYLFSAILIVSFLLIALIVESTGRHQGLKLQL
jgi:hypothetical protein